MAGDERTGSVPTPDPTELTTQQLNLALRGVRDWAHGEIRVLEERFVGIDRATELLNETVNRVPTDLQTAIKQMKALLDVHLQSISTQFSERDQRADSEIKRLNELIDERFHSIETQFKERDTRQERESRDNKVAVDAAFAAQKEAAAKQEETFGRSIDKSEAATSETISKLQDLTSTQDRALAAKIDDGLKSIADKIEDLKDGTIGDLKARISGLEGDLRTALASQEGTKGGHTEHQATAQATSAARSQMTMAVGALLLVLVTLGGIVIAVLSSSGKA